MKNWNALTNPPVTIMKKQPVRLKRDSAICQTIDDTSSSILVGGYSRFPQPRKRQNPLGVDIESLPSGPLSQRRACSIVIDPVESFIAVQNEEKYIQSLMLPSSNNSSNATFSRPPLQNILQQPPSLPSCKVSRKIIGITQSSAEDKYSSKKNSIQTNNPFEQRNLYNQENKLYFYEGVLRGNVLPQDIPEGLPYFLSNPSLVTAKSPLPQRNSSNNSSVFRIKKQLQNTSICQPGLVYQGFPVRSIVSILKSGSSTTTSAAAAANSSSIPTNFSERRPQSSSINARKSQLVDDPPPSLNQQILAQNQQSLNLAVEEKPREVSEEDFLIARSCSTNVFVRRKHTKEYLSGKFYSSNLKRLNMLKTDCVLASLESARDQAEEQQPNDESVQQTSMIRKEARLLSKYNSAKLKAVYLKPVAASAREIRRVLVIQADKLLFAGWTSSMYWEKLSDVSTTQQASDAATIKQLAEIKKILWLLTSKQFWSVLMFSSHSRKTLDFIGNLVKQGFTFDASYAISQPSSSQQRVSSDQLKGIDFQTILSDLTEMNRMSQTAAGLLPWLFIDTASSFQQKKRNVVNAANKTMRQQSTAVFSQVQQCLPVVPVNEISVVLIQQRANCSPLLFNQRQIMDIARTFSLGELCNQPSNLKGCLMPLDFNDITKSTLKECWRAKQKALFFKEIESIKEQEKVNNTVEELDTDKVSENFRNRLIEYLKSTQKPVTNVFHLVGDLVMRNRKAFATYCTHPFHTKKKVKAILFKINAIRQRNKNILSSQERSYPYDILSQDAAQIEVHAECPRDSVTKTTYYMYSE